MVQDEFEMENQGYEEEHSTRSPLNRQYLVQPSPTIVDNSRSSPIAQGIHAIGVHPLRADQDTHVYEDIVVSSLEDSVSTDQPHRLPRNSANNNNNNNSNNNNLCNESLHWSQNGQKENRDVRIVPSINGVASLSPGELEDPSNFHRNLTLPLRRPIGTVDDGGNATRFSVRVTNRERSRCLAGENDSSLCESSVGSTRVGDDLSKVTSLVIDKPGRRRRKKDCKHCKSKANGTVLREHLSDNMVEHSSRHEDSFPVDASGRVEASANNEMIERNEKATLGLEPIFALPDGKMHNFDAKRAGQGTLLSDGKSNSIFSISNNTNGFCSTNGPKLLNYDKNDTDVRLAPVELMDDRALITPQKNRAGMKVNSIYAQDHWQSKDLPIFVTDVKEQSPFQRAYSLPTRTQTPSSQNRVNLRRSVRGEPPPHPARLRKNRHGWTLHFARPLDGTGCTRSIVLLLIAILALLGIGGIALYIVFEPEKLQIIQQYLRSSTTNASTVSNITFERSTMGFESIDTTTLPMASVFLTESPAAFPQETTLSPETETELVPTTSEIAPDFNATRHCDDCYEAEVCVALVDEEVPFCRNGPDPLDPTGCAGLCLINKQKCHRLDVDAFRCVEVEHYCLDDEWTCSNTLCIPLVKHCDGHMNCYDHSDEYDCACDMQTHFQCGNETSCLPLDKRCDGKIDCWDATDEINCTLGQDLGWSCPSSGEFTCSNGECILKARFCDGLRDCTDGSDEPHGCQGRCNKHEYSCLNGRCITKGMKCNGIDDCGDNSDEQHCRDRIYKNPVS